jgi:hypothetical protein
MERVSRLLEIQRDGVSRTKVTESVQGRTEFFRRALDELIVGGTCRKPRVHAVPGLFAGFARTAKNPLTPSPSRPRPHPVPRCHKRPRPPSHLLKGDGDGLGRPIPRLPGDPGYLHRLSVAKENGHVSEGEWESLKLVHQKLAGPAS